MKREIEKLTVLLIFNLYVVKVVFVLTGHPSMLLQVRLWYELVCHAYKSVVPYMKMLTLLHSLRVEETGKHLAWFTITTLVFDALIHSLSFMLIISTIFYSSKPIKVVSSAYCRLEILLPVMEIPPPQ